MRQTIVVAAALICLSACRTTSQTRFLHKKADLGAIQKVAVLPFDNLTSDRAAADKVQKIFYLELLSLDVFEIAEPGQVTKTIRGTPLDSAGVADYQKIGKDLGVDGIFTGTVVDYGEGHSGNTPTPEITIQLRLIEAHTGATIWSVGETRSGASVSNRLFGVGGESLTEAARRVVRAELGTLLK